jgi:hypothetical protein
VPRQPSDRTEGAAAAAVVAGGTQARQTRPTGQTGRYFLYMVGTSRIRPLRRRFFSTFRPPEVAMRARKPCVRARRTLWGWYVRFTGGTGRKHRPGPRSSTRGRLDQVSSSGPGPEEASPFQGRLSRAALITPRFAVRASPLATTDS